MLNVTPVDIIGTQWTTYYQMLLFKVHFNNSQSHHPNTKWVVTPAPPRAPTSHQMVCNWYCAGVHVSQEVGSHSGWTTQSKVGEVDWTRSIGSFRAIYEVICSSSLKMLNQPRNLCIRSAPPTYNGNHESGMINISKCRVVSHLMKQFYFRHAARFHVCKLHTVGKNSIPPEGLPKLQGSLAIIVIL